MKEALIFSRLALQVSGPVMLACLVYMFVSGWKSIGRAPAVREVVYLYVRRSVKARGHAGVYTYLLIVSSLVFFASCVTQLIVQATM